MAKKVIIIEDDPDLLDALQLICKRAGYSVSAYTNGHILLKNEWEIPDIFLIDRQLSGIDGLDLCRHVRSHALASEVPVIILSASPHVHLAAMEAGADAFIEKPFSNKELLRKIETLTGAGLSFCASNSSLFRFWMCISRSAARL